MYLLNKISCIFGEFLLWLLGWKLDNSIKVKKAILIAYPHTTCYDAFIMYIVSFIINLRAIMKADNWYLSIICRLLGFIGVCRFKRSNQTEIIANRISNENTIFIAIAPEGTRQKQKGIRTGFYYIAKYSDTPIICGLLNYKTRIFSFSEPMYTKDLSENEVIDKIREFYHKNNAIAVSRYPKDVSPFIKLSK